MAELIKLDSYHNDNAPGAVWFKSADSDLDHSKDSVGVARLEDGTIAMTQTKDRAASVLGFTPLEMAHFVAAAKSGALDAFTIE